MKQVPFYFVIVLVLLCLQATSSSKNLTENELAQIYFEELENSDYNPQIMPEPAGEDGNPVIINCKLSITDIYKVDEVNMEFQAHFYFRQTWVDPRLAHSYQDIKYIVLNDAKHIWIPDLFFVQEKKGPLQKLVIGIQKNGSVEFSKRFTTFFSCPMDFSRFPHDTQKCSITVESFGHNRSKLELLWDIIEVGGSISLPFEITSVMEETEITTYPTGDYTSLGVELTFQRRIDFFITKLYVPFIFLTILSWLSFWIPAKLLVHRLSLMMVTMYLMVDIGNYINTRSPKSWYMKGSDVWIAVCQSLVFASFLEFIVVHMVEIYSQKKWFKSDPVAENDLDSDSKINPANSEPSNNTVNTIANRLKRNVLLSGRIDKISRIMFPALFVGFNFIYFIVYCTEQ